MYTETHIYPYFFTPHQVLIILYPRNRKFPSTATEQRPLVGDRVRVFGVIQNFFSRKLTQTLSKIFFCCKHIDLESFPRTTTQNFFKHTNNLEYFQAQRPRVIPSSANQHSPPERSTSLCFFRVISYNKSVYDVHKNMYQVPGTYTVESVLFSAFSCCQKPTTSSLYFLPCVVFISWRSYVAGIAMIRCVSFVRVSTLRVYTQ